MSLEQKDLESIERVVYKNADDMDVSIARSFERLEERIDAAESRIYGRLAELEDRLEDRPVGSAIEDFSSSWKAPRTGGAISVRVRGGEGRSPTPLPLPEHLPQGSKVFAVSSFAILFALLLADGLALDIFPRSFRPYCWPEN